MPARDRVIYHLDMNAYFASVEEVLYPELKRVPMAVAGDPESRRGIILAKNELAKGYGVKTAETIYQARRKCPNLVLRPARHGLYEEYCEKANRIYAEYTDLLERASIDESFLDVTGTLPMFGGDPEKLAHEIRMRIERELRLTISVGVSFNKFFAKTASDMKKPNAVTVITRENYREKIWPLPIGDMHMVGRSTAAVLTAMNILTIGDLAVMDEKTLRDRLGKHGICLRANANGLDASPVFPIDRIEDVKSVGNGITFKRDLISREDILTAIGALSGSVAARLRHQGLKCRAVQVTIKDPSFKVITRQKALPAPSHLSSDLESCAMELIDANWPKDKPIRLLTVTALKLVEKERAVEQLSLFDSPEVQLGREKRENLERVMDKIRQKYGPDSILSASVVKNDLGIHGRYSDQED